MHYAECVALRSRNTASSHKIKDDYLELLKYWKAMQSNLFSMAFLPPTALALTGGCLCRAIRYTINIPEISLRPFHPSAAPTPSQTPSGNFESLGTRLPLIELDHCTSCRLAAGSIVQSWIVAPKSWVEWKLIAKLGPSHQDTNKIVPKPSEEEYKIYSAVEIIEPSEDLLKSTYLSQFTSSENVHRAFCSRCSTSLTYCFTGPKPGWTLPERNFDVALGTLDKECLEIEGVKPERHSWWSDGISWFKKMVREGDRVGGMRLVRHETGAVNKVMNEHEERQQL
jgi:hypothetical protein